TIRVRLNEVVAPFLYYLANPQIVAMIPKDSAPPEGRITNPIGTGPYKFVEWVPGSYLSVERFEAYTPRPFEPTGLGGRKEVHFDRLVIRVIPEGSTFAAALETGEVHFGVQVPVAQLERLNRNANLSVLEEESMVSGWLITNFQSKWL